MEQKPRVYFENLDGLRFFCFLAVFLFHSFHTTYSHIRDSSAYRAVKYFLVVNGNLGVNFFFVLSGFLITFLLFKEKEVFGKVNIVSFWKRRILRIWPLFFSCIFFGFVIFPWLKQQFGEQPHETADPVYYLTFLNNFDFIRNGADASVLSVLWSVAVEEQFYLLWPVLLFVVPAKWYASLFCGILLVSLSFRAIYDNAAYNEYHTLSCIGDMTIGAFGALWIQRWGGQQSVERWSRFSLIALYGLVLFVFLFRKQLFYNFYVIRVIERPFVAVLFLLVILEQSYSRHSLFKCSRLKTISALGEISYGLYCLHFVGILITTQLFNIFHFNTNVWQILILETGVALAITILIAKLSFRYLELPFLKMKSRIARIGTSRY